MMLYLSDMNTHFKMILDGQRVPIQFGEYSLSLANIDYNKLQVFLEDYLRVMIESFDAASTLAESEFNNWPHFKKHKELFAKVGIYPNKISGETIQKYIRTMETPLYNFLNSGYLNNAQLRIVTQLILSELDSRIRCAPFIWKLKVPTARTPCAVTILEVRAALDINCTHKIGHPQILKTPKKVHRGFRNPCVRTNEVLPSIES